MWTLRFGGIRSLSYLHETTYVTKIRGTTPFDCIIWRARGFELFTRGYICWPDFASLALGNVMQERPSGNFWLYFSA